MSVKRNLNTVDTKMSDPDHHDQSGDNDRVTEEWKTNLIRKMSDENSSQKTVKVFMHIFLGGGVHYSSLDLSVPTNLWSHVLFQSTPSMFFSI